MNDITFNREEYAKTIIWNQMKCKWHPDRQAVIQINPPIGSFMCTECWREMEIMKIRNKGVGF